MTNRNNNLYTDTESISTSYHLELKSYLNMFKLNIKEEKEDNDMDIKFGKDGYTNIGGFPNWVQVAIINLFQAYAKDYIGIGVDSIAFNDTNRFEKICSILDNFGVVYNKDTDCDYPTITLNTLSDKFVQSLRDMYVTQKETNLRFNDGFNTLNVILGIKHDHLYNNDRDRFLSYVDNECTRYILYPESYVNLVDKFNLFPKIKLFISKHKLQQFIVNLKKSDLNTMITDSDNIISYLSSIGIKYSDILVSIISDNINTESIRTAYDESDNDITAYDESDNDIECVDDEDSYIDAIAYSRPVIDNSIFSRIINSSRNSITLTTNTFTTGDVLNKENIKSAIDKSLEEYKTAVAKLKIMQYTKKQFDSHGGVDAIIENFRKSCEKKIKNMYESIEKYLYI